MKSLSILCPTNANPRGLQRITLAKGNGQSAEVTRACHELYAIRTNSKLETNALTSDLGNEVEEIKPCDFNDILGWSGGEGIWLEREVVTIKTPIPLVHVFRRSRSKSAAGLEVGPSCNSVIRHNDLPSTC